MRAGKCGTARSALSLASSLLRQLSLPRARAHGSRRRACIDEAIRDELNARRQYRGVQERLFQKARRHEVSVLGGAYAADLMSSSWLVGGAYTFHFSEDLGLEASVGYTQARSEVVEHHRDRPRDRPRRERVPVWLYQGHLIWTLAYGKLRWFGSRISRFDFAWRSVAASPTTVRAQPDLQRRLRLQVFPERAGSRCASTCATRS